MNDVYTTKMATAFLSELSEIEKQGFAPLRFLGSGFKNIAGAMTKKVPMGMSGSGAMASRIGGRGAVRAGGVGKHMGQIWRAGAGKAQKAGGSQFLGGLGALGRSRYGQMAGAAAVPIGVGAAGASMFGGQ